MDVNEINNAVYNRLVNEIQPNLGQSLKTS